MYKFGVRLAPLYLNVSLQSVFVVHMSSACLADVQDFWILLWMIFFAIMMTVDCLELLSQTEIYNSGMFLFSYLWLIIFDVLAISSYVFSFGCWWKWETTHKLKSINNKCFVYYHQQDDKGELCLRVGSLRTRVTLGPSSPRMRKRKEKRAWRVVWENCMLVF